MFQVAPLFFMASLVVAEKKIELQDIEEDNLRSEKETQLEKSGARSPEPSSASAPGLPLDFLKNGYFQYYKEAEQSPQQQRYVHQYAVTEQPERPLVTPTPQYGPPAPQPAMVGYLSNVPMQLYLLPQYYNEPSEQVTHQQLHPEVQLPSHTVAQVSGYQDATHAQQSGYYEVPAYVTPTGKSYIQQYTQPISYVTYAHPTIPPIQSTITPVLTYQMPVVHYQTAISAPPPKGYYQSTQYPDTNEVQENEVNIPKPYSSHNDIHLTNPSGLGYPRYYNSRTPVTEGYRTAPVELPHPSPLLLKAPPSHLAHIPKALPMYRPITKPVYATGGGFSSSTFTPRPSESFGGPYKRRPTSLLDSYIPSSVQIEYMKRGHVKDALSAYEALSSGRHLSQSQSQVYPRHYERGFLPNQIYHTAGGGITYGHHKRAPKLDKITKK